jgi:GNAT superfamily N-acetyltransferase
VNVRRAAIGDEGLIRGLRLEALTHDPAAFGSTYERELARTADDWRRWLSPGVVFLLEDASGPHGLVAAAHDPVEPAVVQLMAMWVRPEERGAGAAGALVDAVVEWARCERATTVRLDVLDDNRRARRFYERAGFIATGVTRVRDTSHAIEIQMERAVAPHDRP